MGLALTDLPIIAFLGFLECILSLDNAVALALLARKLPLVQRRRALSYGLIGAIGFRLILLLGIGSLLRWKGVQIAGGIYLIIVGVRHFLHKEHKKNRSAHPLSFWKTVIAIELTDLAFSADSILAALAVSRKWVVVFLGGMAGVISMRWTAAQISKLLDVFPHLEATGHALMVLIGGKLLLEAVPLDFHYPAIPFFAFWGSMLGTLAVGFRR